MLRFQRKEIGVINYEKHKKSMYWDARGKIFSFLNKFLHDTLCLQPNITLIIVILILKSLKLWRHLPKSVIHNSQLH